MADERTPKSGDEYMYLDGDEEWNVGRIMTVGEQDADTGTWPIKDYEGRDAKVYWSDGDESWVESEE